MPSNCSPMEIHDYSENESTKNIDLFDICRTGPYIDRYGNINKFAQEKRDIIIESSDDIKLKLGGQPFYCKKGKHFFSKFLFRWHSFVILKGQNYALHVLNNNSEEREYFFKMMVWLFDRQLVYIDGIYGESDNDKYVCHMAGCFGGIPDKSREVCVNSNSVIEYIKKIQSSRIEILNPPRETLTYTLKIQHDDLYKILEDDDVECLINKSPWEYLTKVPSTMIHVKETDFDNLHNILLNRYFLKITRPCPDTQYRNKTEEEINNDNLLLVEEIKEQINSINKYVEIGYLLVNV